MKGIFFIAMIMVSANAFSQLGERKWGDQKTAVAVAALQKDPEYKSFKAKLDAMVVSAKGKMTNSAKVKALFAGNKNLLNNLYKKHGVENRMLVPKSSSQYFAMKDVPKYVFKRTNENPQSVLVYDVFDHRYIWDGTPYGTSHVPFDLHSNPYNGDVTITCPPDMNKDNWGLAMILYQKNITVPDDPGVRRAVITLEYSFTYTGWDTEGAINGMDLGLRIDSTFHSSYYSSLPNTENWKEGEVQKRVATLIPRDTVTTDFKEIDESSAGTITLEGYVVPGSRFNVNFGIIYPLGTMKGINGIYHYGEFDYKKLTVSFYK